MKLRIRAAAAALLAGACVLAHAAFPDRPIKLIVPFPPGGNIDATARIVAAALSQPLGQPVVVENKAGASGQIGAEFVARSPADGYTILLGSSGALAPAKALNPAMKLDPIKDFEAATPIARAPMVLVVNPQLPVKNVKELIALAKAKPGQMAAASPGTGTLAHLSAILFESVSNIKLLHVPYKGSAPAVTDLIGGQVQISFDQLASTLPNIKAGKLRAIGVATAQRSAIVPDIPTLQEQGLAGFESSTTTALLLPAGTPREVMDKINAVWREVQKSPKVREQFHALGSDVLDGTGADFDKVIATELAKWTKVVKDADVQLP
jgi:tripartite-type tricarboxylate transporter receptor subunit TctC